MSEWKECTLGEVIILHDKQRIPLSSMQRQNRKGCYPYYGAQGIIDYIDNYIFDGEYILIAEDGENLKSRQQDIACLVNGKFWVNNHAHIATNNDKSSIIFLYYLINFLDISCYITGSVQPKLNQDMLRKIEFLLPKLPEQKAIAEVLSSLDDKIDLLNRQNTTLEALAETYFRQWFFEEADGETSFISNYAKLENISANPKSMPNELFYHYSIPAYDDGKKPIHEFGKEILSNKFKVPSKVILVSKLNPITPRVWAVLENNGENCVCSTEFQVLKPLEEKYFCYLYFLLKTQAIVAELAMSASGTSGSHQRIRPEYILNVEMAKPSENRIKEFNEAFGDLINKIDNNLKQIQTLQRLRDTLLPKLISGEIKVKM